MKTRQKSYHTQALLLAIVLLFTFLFPPARLQGHLITASCTSIVRNTSSLPLATESVHVKQDHYVLAKEKNYALHKSQKASLSQENLFLAEHGLFSATPRRQSAAGFVQKGY